MQPSLRCSIVHGILTKQIDISSIDPRLHERICWAEKEPPFCDVDCDDLFAWAVGSDRVNASSPWIAVAQATEQRLKQQGDTVHELRLRTQPICAQWETYGQGLLLQMERAIGRALEFDGTAIRTVYPILGGSAYYVDSCGTVIIEAVLANPMEAVPEVLRLAWAVSQTTIHDEKDRFNQALSLIPVCLSAGAELGLCTYDPPIVQAAAELWLRRHPVWHNRSYDVQEISIKSPSTGTNPDRESQDVPR